MSEQANTIDGQADELLVGTRKGLFTLRRRNGDWQITTVDFIGEPVTAVVADPASGRVWAALGTGHFGVHLWRRDDGRWAEIPTPAYPPRPDDATDVDPFRKEPIPWSTDLAWALELGGPQHPERLWCGTIPGGLFRSDDGGDSWVLNEALWHNEARSDWFGAGYDWPGIHSISPHPDIAGSMLVGVSIGGAWVTTDDGDTWTATTGMVAPYVPPKLAGNPNNQDPHRLARCAAAPEVIWNQHHSASYRSTDGGRTWTELPDRPPSVFGFAVAAHPTDPDTAWFVSAVQDECRVPVDGQVSITRTTDGGRTWSVHTEGLPGPHAYDLVYRHALDVGPNGTQLVMGSTTGSLWASEDGGERWATVSANLPPVNVVRIVPTPSV